jgi:hypothetical protein
MGESADEIDDLYGRPGQVEPAVLGPALVMVDI